MAQLICFFKMWPHPRLTISESLRMWARICIVNKLSKFWESLVYGDNIEWSLHMKLNLLITLLNLSAVVDPFNIPSFWKPLFHLFSGTLNFSWFFSYSTGYFFSIHLAGSSSFFWSPNVGGSRAWSWNLFFSLSMLSLRYDPWLYYQL